MNAEFSVLTDPPRGALRVSMGGFFLPADVARFAEEVQRKLDLLGLAPNAHLMLCDVRRMKIQTQDIVAAFSQIVGNPRYRSKRLAFVTGSSLSRLQAQRLTTREGVAWFSDLTAAEAWLFDGAQSGALDAVA